MVCTEPDIGAHRSVPGWVSSVPIRCRNRGHRHSPDASLLGVGVSASASVGRHDGARRRGCVDSARWRGGATPAWRSARTHPHNKCCRDHSGCRSAPAPHNVGSCRADSSAARTPAMPLPKHWTVLGQGRHKGPAQAPFPGTAHRGLGGSDANLETLGPRFFDLSPASISQTLRHASAPPNQQQELRTAVRGRPCHSDIREKESVIRPDTDAINQPRIAHGNQQLKSAPIARKARVSTAINTVWTCGTQAG